MKFALLPHIMDLGVGGFACVAVACGFFKIFVNKSWFKEKQPSHLSEKAVISIYLRFIQSHQSQS
jgi:hypothetical protein